MPPSVASLDERITEIATDVSDLKALTAAHSAKLDMMSSQLATVINGLATSQAQMATMIARFESLAANLDRTDARLEATNRGLENLVGDFREFQGKTGAMIGTAKWIAAFAATTVVAIIATGYVIAREAGRLESRVEQQQQTLDEIRTKLK